MELPLTDSDVLEGLLDRFSENPTTDRRRAIVSLFQATVNDARAYIRSQAESLGLVCAGRDGLAERARASREDAYAGDALR